MLPRSFASDNNAGIHPQIFEAIRLANGGHVRAYGDDPFTERAVARFKQHLGEAIQVHFVFNGTGANVLGLSTLVRPYHAILTAQTAHIQVDECGAPEKHLGCKLVHLPAPDGKLTPAIVGAALTGIGDQHHVQPKVISISQSTEYGTVYAPAEIRALADFAHRQGLYLHMDGARIANAAAGLGLPLSAITRDAGVDVLSFGGTKNGLLMGEAVVIFDPRLGADFKFLRKQGMQLASKMRFIAAQFEALLTEDLWLKNATHANRMAQLLAGELKKIPAVRITMPVEANAVFAVLPPAVIPRLQQRSFFYVWNEARSEVRLMASYDTQPEDIAGLVAGLKQELHVMLEG